MSESKLATDVKNDLRKKALVGGLRDDLDQIDKQIGMLWAYLDQTDHDYLIKERVFKSLIEKIKSAQSRVENFRID